MQCQWLSYRDITISHQPCHVNYVARKRPDAMVVGAETLTTNMRSDGNQIDSKVQRSTFSASALRLRLVVNYRRRVRRHTETLGILLKRDRIFGTSNRLRCSEARCAHAFLSNLLLGRDFPEGPHIVPKTHRCQFNLSKEVQERSERKQHNHIVP